MDKLSEAQALRQNMLRLQDDLKTAQNKLRRLEESCDHKFSKPEYCPEIIEGYTDPGDPPGFGGVDRRLPCYIPGKTIKKWKRICAKCGKVEITDRINKKSIEEPSF